MPTKMKAVVKPGPAPGAELATVDVPPPRPDEVLVKVKAASICGSDVHIWNWDAWARSRITPPLTIGHEFCGEIVEVGAQVSGLKAGDYVSAESHVYCGYCYQCRTELRHICGNLKILGVDINGGFAEFVAVPARCAWKNDPSLPIEVGSILEPLGNAVFATLCEDVTGKSVAVFGCGPQGLFAIAVAKAAGASLVLGIETVEYRRDMAFKMGADAVFDPAEPDVVQKLVNRTREGNGVDVVLEMSGHPVAIKNGFQCLRKGGRFTAFGIPSDPITMDLANDVIFKGARIVGINGRQIFQTWYQMAGLLASGALDVKPVITHKFPLAEFAAGFDAMRSRDKKCGKVVLLP